MKKDSSDTAQTTDSVIHVEISAAAYEMIGTIDLKEKKNPPQLVLISSFHLNLKGSVDPDIFYKRVEKNRLPYCTLDDIYDALADFWEQIPKNDFVVFGMKPILNSTSHRKEVLIFWRQKKDKIFVDVFKIPNVLWEDRIFLFRDSE